MDTMYLFDKEVGKHVKAEHRRVVQIFLGEKTQVEDRKTITKSDPIFI